MLKQENESESLFDITDIKNRLGEDKEVLHYYRCVYVIAQCDNDNDFLKYLLIFENARHAIKDYCHSEEHREVRRGRLGEPSFQIKEYESLKKELNECDEKVEQIARHEEKQNNSNSVESKELICARLLWRIWLKFITKEPHNEEIQLVQMDEALLSANCSFKRAEKMLQQEREEEVKESRSIERIKKLGEVKKFFLDRKNLRNTILLFFYKLKLFNLSFGRFNQVLLSRDNIFHTLISEEIAINERLLNYFSKRINPDNHQALSSLCERIKREIELLEKSRKLLEIQDSEFIAAICKELVNETAGIIDTLEKQNNLAQRLLTIKLQVYGFLLKDAIKTNNRYLQILITSRIDGILVLEILFKLELEQIKAWLQTTQPTINWSDVAKILEAKNILDFQKLGEFPEAIKKIMAFFTIAKEILPYSNFTEKGDLMFAENSFMPRGNLLHYLIIQKHYVVSACVYYLIFIKNHFAVVEADSEFRERTYYCDVLNNKNLPANNEAITMTLQVIQEFDEIIRRLLIKSHLNLHDKTESGIPNWNLLQGAIFSADYSLVHQFVLAGTDLTLKDSGEDNKESKSLLLYDFGTVFSSLVRYPPKNAYSPLQLAVNFHDEWLVHYFLALYNKAELKRIFEEDVTLEKKIESCFPGALEWAEEMRNEVHRIRRNYGVVSQVCKSAQFGWLPFSTLKIESEKESSNQNENLFPQEVSILILSFICGETFLSRNWLFNNLINIPVMNNRLQLVWFGTQTENVANDKETGTFIVGEKNEKNKKSNEKGNSRLIKDVKDDKKENGELMNKDVESIANTLDHKPNEERKMYIEFVFRELNEKFNKEDEQVNSIKVCALNFL